MIQLITNPFLLGIRLTLLNPALLLLLLQIFLSVQDDPVQPRHYRFPATYFGTKERSFNPMLFEKYVWLEYSISRDAVFCYDCRFFMLGSQTDDLFLKKGYRDWKHATGTTGALSKHNNSLKHKQSMASWNDFKVNQRQHTSVATLLDSQRKEQISNNQGGR